MYKPVDTQRGYNERELDILRFWESNQIFEKSIRNNGKSFVFYEGPPTANGKPGIHHVMSRTIKDTVTRYKAMQGFRVERKAGWDTHGLPVEIQVEKDLGIQGREEIFKYGLEKFNNACRASVFTYKDLWDELTRRMGYWVDLTEPYITCEDDYIESVWWILNQLYERDLVYKGHKIQPYCPLCGTALSSHEVSQGYKDVKDLTAIARFPLTDAKNTYILAWTTTPWTLPSNVALAVGENIEYVYIDRVDDKNGRETVILAKELVADVISGEYTIIKTVKGSDLVGLKYAPLFDFVETNDATNQVYSAEFVTTSDGTGIVHMAPAYGEDDYKLCTENGIPVDIIVQADGTFSERAGEFAGLNIKTADPEIVTNLKHRGLLYKSQKWEHSYPHCWRHGTPLFYYATDSWFIRTTRFRDQLLKNNKTINWYPADIGTGRFGKWLENNIDWALSRNRYWGTPLNIWLTEDESESKSIGSMAELKAEISKAVEAGMMDAMPENLELHKPTMDTIILVSDSGKPMRRTPEVIDCWFDSGSMPLAQLHYPFENKDRVENGDAFPADFICEGIDQTRGWFYTLLAISTMLFDKPPYKNVIVNNLILDKDGFKMSKSRGNTVDPNALITKYGIDTLRWFFLTTSNPWISKRFDEDALVEVQRKFIGTLMNTYAFYVLYANVDSYEHQSEALPVADRPEIDQWIVSLLYTTVEKVEHAYDEYDLTTAGRTLSEFLINDVSNWYVRRNRRRFWKGEMSADKQAAYATLYEVLMTVIKMSAPMIPFLSEEIYQNLKSDDDPESIHLSDFPSLNEDQKKSVNHAVEAKMGLAQRVVEQARALRSEHQIKVRQPLAQVKVYLEHQDQRNAVVELAEIISEELNVKSVELVENVNELAIRKARPNFKLLGPKFGKQVNLVANQIKAFDDTEISAIENGQPFQMQLNGETIEIDLHFFDIIHEEKDELVVSSDGDVTVALDTHLTDELIEEGLAREVVSKLQQMRKEIGLDVVDRIRLKINTEESLKQAIRRQQEYVQTETLTETIEFDDGLTEGTSVTIENQTLHVDIEKV